MKNQNIELSLKSLSNLLLSNSGTFFGELDVYDLPREIELHESILYSPELEFFYKNYNFNFHGIGGLNIGFSSHNNLPRKQEGYELKDGWVVFADFNDDPIVADTKRVGSPVLAAIEGLDYKEIAPSLGVFFKLCEVLVHNSIEGEASAPDAEEEFEAYLNYQYEVVRMSFLEQAKNILENEYLENFNEFFYS